MDLAINAGEPRILHVDLIELRINNGYRTHARKCFKYRLSRETFISITYAKLNNSCFATLEQQASPHSRGKALVVAAYDSPGGCLVAPSIEAKKLGIKTGMSVREARILCPDVIVRTPHPALYRDAHMKFRNIFLEYTPDVAPTSIDEAILDFSRVNNQVLFRKRHWFRLIPMSPVN
jgi:DNA polymerase IV